MKEDRAGWWDVGAHVEWKCPKCGVVSSVDDWENCDAACDDCGSHDGRECPKCGEVFDHVWGAETLALANPGSEVDSR